MLQRRQEFVTRRKSVAGEFAISTKRSHVTVMTTSQTAPPTAKTIRLIHASLITGTVLFAIVTQVWLRPAWAELGAFPPELVRLLLGVGVALCAASLFFRGRVPRKSGDESADRFWTRANAPAMITWSLANGAGLISVLAYAKSGDIAAIAVAAIAVLFLAALRPGYFERR